MRSIIWIYNISVVNFESVLQSQKVKVIGRFRYPWTVFIAYNFFNFTFKISVQIRWSMYYINNEINCFLSWMWSWNSHISHINTNKLSISSIDFASKSLATHTIIKHFKPSSKTLRCFEIACMTCALQIWILNLGNAAVSLVSLF